MRDSLESKKADNRRHDQAVNEVWDNGLIDGNWLKAHIDIGRVCKTLTRVPGSRNSRNDMWGLNRVHVEQLQWYMGRGCDVYISLVDEYNALRGMYTWGSLDIWTPCHDTSRSFIRIKESSIDHSNQRH